jgi:predicted DNA-binding transcriptional regulator YafY
MNRATHRALDLLDLLVAHGQLRGPDLAERLGVDARTLRRDVERLEALGVPIVAERGRFGGYGVVPGYRPPAHLLRRRPGDGSGTVDVLAAAVRAGRRVWMRYVSSGGTAQGRDVDPYGVGSHGGHWYVVGHCHLRGGVRTFRVDRIQAVQVSATEFERPVAFDVEDHLTEAIATMPRAHAIEVLVEAEPDEVRQRLFASIGRFEPCPEGTRLLAQADDLAWFARELARLPWAFRILKPRALRARLRDHARGLLRSAQE